ncbi:MAG: diguanylate cyclase domain-containing protein [Candidatus Methylumidiphilus sp.]
MTINMFDAQAGDCDYLQAVSVLYVEDDADIREQLRQFLIRRVGGLLTAENGAVGLALFRASQPDIVVTDILMPVMDGLAMVRAIRESAPRLPVIITTAFNETDFLLQAIDLAVDAYVLKPVNGARLEAVLCNCARNLCLENALAESNKLLRRVLSSLHEAVFVIDAAVRTVYECNKTAETLFGCGREEIIGHAPDCLRLDWERIAALPSEPEAAALRQERMRRKNGELFFAEHYVYPILGARGQLAYVVSVVRDISLQKQREDALLDTQCRLDFLAHHDPLTGLTNRLLFQDRLRHAQARARRSGKLLAVLFVDLDGFKRVNDCFGHDLGDELLQAVAERLLAAVREQDTVARFGGDEFVLLLEELEDAEAAGRVAQALIDALARPFDLQGRLLEIGASVGVSLLGAGGEGAESMVRQADEAMYQAKQAGGRCFRWRVSSPA